jgi:hypothetical protein
MRAFFLFLFFYSNDSNSLGTWSTFGAGMLLSNLGVHLPARVPRPYFHVLEREGTARAGSETAWLCIAGFCAPVRAFVRACSRVCLLCGLAGGQASVTLFFAVGPRCKAASLEATRGVARCVLRVLRCVVCVRALAWQQRSSRQTKLASRALHHHLSSLLQSSATRRSTSIRHKFLRKKYSR